MCRSMFAGEGGGDGEVLSQLGIRKVDVLEHLADLSDGVKQLNWIEEDEALDRIAVRRVCARGAFQDIQAYLNLFEGSRFLVTGRA